MGQISSTNYPSSSYLVPGVCSSPVWKELIHFWPSLQPIVLSQPREGLRALNPIATNRSRGKRTTPLVETKAGRRPFFRTVGYTTV
ncbi:hypothetical protein J6590_058931 [Homalodisca vitripennis]|nr:hypothetical protein J6590_058931 [Homalodisca vitripennis]